MTSIRRTFRRAMFRGLFLALLGLLSQWSLAAMTPPAWAAQQSPQAEEAAETEHEVSQGETEDDSDALRVPAAPAASTWPGSHKPAEFQDKSRLIARIPIPPPDL